MSDYESPEHRDGHERVEESAADSRARVRSRPRVEQGNPGSDNLLAFLNAAFEGWGPRPYFEWKYDRYPGYNPDEHNFYATDVAGRLVASRRLFEKELVVPETDENIGFFVHGGAAVAHDHRGRGLFSRLVAASREYSRAQGAPLVVTFNRRGKVSTLAHLNHDWSYRTLPLYVRVLSARTAVSEYAEDLLRDRPLLAKVARWGFPRVAVSDGRLRLDGSPDTRPRWGLRLSDAAVRALVEIGGRGRTPTESVRILLGLLWNGAVRVGRLDETRGDELAPPAELPTGVTATDDLSESELDAVVSLFEAELDSYDLAFRRDHADIRHQLEYPGAEALLVTDGETPIGFAVVGFLDRGAATEARVLDAVAATDAVFDTLVEAVEALAAHRGADILAFVSDDDPGPAWARVNTDLVMWDWLDRDESLDRRLTAGDWRIRIYDAV